MRLIEQEEERDRRPPWYMTPEQLLELQEEIQQQDRQLEQRLIDLRQRRRSHRRCCVVNVLEEDVKKAKKEVKESDNAIVEKKVEKPVVCKQIQRELEEYPSSSVKQQYVTVEYREELKRFREQLGPTEGCSACERGAHGRHHTRSCKTRKLEWIEQNQREHDQRQEGERRETLLRGGHADEPSEARERDGQRCIRPRMPIDIYGERDRQADLLRHAVDD
jgi:hypothetical protein